MPSRDVHNLAGEVSTGGYAAYRSSGSPGPQFVVETAAGVTGGIREGMIPDAIDAPWYPRHRAAAHRVSVTGALGHHLNHGLPEWRASLRNRAQHYAYLRTASPSLIPQISYGLLELLCYFLSGVLARLLAGYASHLALDSLTPSSLPILC